MSEILLVEDDRTTRVFLGQALKAAGHTVTAAADGAAGMKHLGKKQFDLVLMDIWMPKVNGLEMLAQMRATGKTARAVVMTSDDTPETLLRAVREQAWHYITKPIDPKSLVELVRDALDAAPVPPIEVISARPDWVELLVPCDMNAARRIQSYMERLKTDLDEEARESIGKVFHEMLMNAIEWGGQLDPNRKVRISFVRGRRVLLYRISDPGPGFRFHELTHAAVSHPGEPIRHMAVREEKGLRPGGFGILMAQALVDELIYNEVQNEVLFMKYLE